MEVTTSTMQIKNVAYSFNPEESGMLDRNSATQMHISFDAPCYGESNLRHWDEGSLSDWFTSFLSIYDHNIQAHYFQNHLQPLEMGKFMSTMKVLTVFADNDEKTTQMLTTCSIWHLCRTQL